MQSAEDSYGSSAVEAPADRRKFDVFSVARWQFLADRVVPIILIDLGGPTHVRVRIAFIEWRSIDEAPTQYSRNSSVVMSR